MTFAPGERLKTIGVPIAGDVLVESDETVVLALSNLRGATFWSRLNPVGGTARASGTITDDDDPPTAIELDASPLTVSEDASATPVTVTASFPSGTALSSDTSVAVEIGPRANDAIDATRGTDYTAPEDLTVTIPAGRTTGTAEFVLTPIDDGAVERAQEQIVLSGTVPEEYGTRSLFVRLFLIDDDAAARLVLSPAEIVEGGVATVSATLSRTVAGDTTLTVSAAPETGTDAADFTLNGMTLTIPEGQTSSTGTVTVTANEDADEDHERVRISATASSAGSATVAAPAAVTLAIRDNDVTNVPATGAPLLSGSAQVGQALRASPGTIADADGLTGVSYAWQWVRVESDNTENDIAGANSDTYTPVAADLGRRLKVRATFSDDAGNPESRTSAGERGGDRGDGTAPTAPGRQHPGHRRAGDCGHRAGGRDADGRRGRHRRRQRTRQRQLRLAVDSGRERRHGGRHRRGDRGHLHPGRGGRGPDPQGPRELHRRCGQRRGAHQRRHRAGDGGLDGPGGASHRALPRRRALDGERLPGLRAHHQPLRRSGRRCASRPSTTRVSRQDR